MDYFSELCPRIICGIVGMTAKRTSKSMQKRFFGLVVSVLNLKRINCMEFIVV